MGFSLNDLLPRALHVLLVEEDPRAADRLLAALSGADSSVLAIELVEDLGEALSRLLHEQHDLALVAEGAEGGGLCLLEEVTASGCAVPLILLAARDDDPTLEPRAAAAGAAGALEPRDLADPRALERTLRFLDRGLRGERQRSAERLALLSGYLEREGRNATAGIVGAVDLIASMRSPVRDGDQVRDAIDARLRALLGTIHNVALLSDLPEPARRRLCLRELLSELARAVQTDQPAVAVEVLGPSAPLRADARLLRLLFSSLLQNSIEALGAPGGRVRAAVMRDGAGWCVVIDDDAQLPPGPPARLLQPFVTTKPTSLGLGLAIARRVAEAHGGGLELRASPRGGLVVQVTLPLGEVARSRDPIARLVG